MSAENLSPAAIIAKVIDDFPDGVVFHGQGHAERILAALTAAGLKIVPIAPTEAMVDAAMNNRDTDYDAPGSVWRAMVEAA